MAGSVDQTLSSVSRDDFYVCSRNTSTHTTIQHTYTPERDRDRDRETERQKETETERQGRININVKEYTILRVCVNEEQLFDI